MPRPDRSAELAALLDHAAIEQLQCRYADICTRRAFEDLHDLFLPDATIVLDLRGRDVTIRGPGELGRFIGGSLEMFDFFQFAIRNTVIELGIGGDPDAAAARMWMSEFRHTATAADEGAGTAAPGSTDAGDSSGWSTIFGLYQDRYRRGPAGWRFERRLYQSLARPADGLVFDQTIIPFDR